MSNVTLDLDQEKEGVSMFRMLYTCPPRPQAMERALNTNSNSNWHRNLEFGTSTYRANNKRPLCVARERELRPDTVHLLRIARRRSGPVTFQEGRLVEVSDADVSVGVSDGRGLHLAARLRDASGAPRSPVAIRCRAADDAPDRVPVAHGVWQPLDQQTAHRFGLAVAVGIGIERVAQGRGWVRLSDASHVHHVVRVKVEVARGDKGHVDLARLERPAAESSPTRLLEQAVSYPTDLVYQEMSFERNMPPAGRMVPGLWDPSQWPEKLNCDEGTALGAIPPFSRKDQSLCSELFPPGSRQANPTMAMGSCSSSFIDSSAKLTLQ